MVYRSKLQICVQILCTLSAGGPMNLTLLTKKVELDKPQLVSHLKLLKNRHLMGKEVLGENNILYFITDRGITILKVINPLVREAKRIQERNFELISNILSVTAVAS